MGKKLPDNIVREAMRLRIEGSLSYREIAAILRVPPSSLGPYLKDVPKGVRNGPAVIEVPVSGAGQLVFHSQRICSSAWVSL